MGVPQILVIVLYSIGIGISVTEHGKPKTGKNSCVSTLIASLIMGGLLWWGGFWS